MRVCVGRDEGGGGAHLQVVESRSNGEGGGELEREKGSTAVD